MTDDGMDAIFIEKFDVSNPLDAVAIKDIIDVKGSRTTAGSEYLANHNGVSDEDATCLAPLRKAGIELVGKTNLAEVAFGTSGKNIWSGTPQNPFGSEFIPGGSSSGSAVAVAKRLCHFALGTDTGGSIRIPAACCGIVGLKPTFGTISTLGVRPLAPSMDVVGPMARNCSDLRQAFGLLAPYIETPKTGLDRLSRLRVSGVDPKIEEAIDHALDAAGLIAEESSLSEQDWSDGIDIGDYMLWAEAADANSHLLPNWDKFQNCEKFHIASRMRADNQLFFQMIKRRNNWSYRLRNTLEDEGFLITPTIECFTPTFKRLEREEVKMARFTIPVNLAGLPAIAFPLPTNGPIPASMQIIGAEHSEYHLMTIAQQIEDAISQ